MGSFGDGGVKYLQWCAQFAVSLDIGVPWMMCQQNNPVAPPPMVKLFDFDCLHMKRTHTHTQDVDV